MVWSGHGGSLVPPPIATAGMRGAALLLVSWQAAGMKRAGQVVGGVGRVQGEMVRWWDGMLFLVDVAALCLVGVPGDTGRPAEMLLQLPWAWRVHT